MFELVIVEGWFATLYVLSHRISSAFAFEVRVVGVELNCRLRVVVLVVMLVRLIPGRNEFDSASSFCL